MTDLTRFLDAQADSYDTALAELRAGRKATHWMWYIFPQLAALGRSATAKFYGIADMAEARAYLADPALGPRLVECAEAVIAHGDKPAEEIMGPVDALKLRSSATLFDRAGGNGVFKGVLNTFYGGAPCPLTLQELDRGP
ncbi:hypothetical protein RGUI_2017 [Rhodovulum sp. P5]|uniref:DUF1810 domain-containing protein n=1 Tax=Rhodovulum sp. P5 TaxID=1564506 RepID=UPI0009C32EFF|nr:DUF1810 domain-containing protein [Rhodovulum sp. P5]ARE40158.1 hypothetical protein RGUI_2017 [Rhodovulum sp. P5]